MAPLPPPTKHTHNPTNKREKRISKHATLLSRIAKSAPGPSKVTKRRRPSKKLVASLESLADALPGSTAEAAAADEAWEGIASGGADSGVKIQHKSLKSKPGARKKKEKLVAMERERFARNLAEMAAGSSSSSSSRNATADGRMIIEGGRESDGTRGGSADRWAAIRGFISQTMERRPGGEAGVGGKK